MGDATVEAAADDQVRALIDEWVRASCAKDIDRIMSCYAPDVLAFDAIAALRFAGAEAYRRHWETCLAQMPDPMHFAVHDLSVTGRDDLAFCHYLARCGGTGPDGTEHAGWLRATVCCRRADGRWRIVHEHFSSPFDPQSGNVLHLEP